MIIEKEALRDEIERYKSELEDIRNELNKVQYPTLLVLELCS